MRKTGCMRAARCFFAPKWKGKVNPMESSNQFLGTERIGKLMQKYAIPCIISLLVGGRANQTTFNVVYFCISLPMRSVPRN